MRDLDDFTSPAFKDSVDDIRTNVLSVVPKDVLLVTPRRFLSSLPRYMQGIVWRLRQLRGHVPKDRQHIAQVSPLERRWQSISQAELHDPETDTELFFYLQELRLKLFAQPVAAKKQLDPPLDPQHWKISIKRVEERLLEEERRVGLA